MRTCCITCVHIVEGEDGKAVCDKENNLKVRSAVCRDSTPSGLPLRLHLCTCCMRLLPLSDFNKNNRAPSGYCSCCRECNRMISDRERQDRRKKEKRIIGQVTCRPYHPEHPEEFNEDFWEITKLLK